MNKLVQFIQYMENRENDQDQLLKADTLLKEMEKVGNQQQLRKER
ncbi:MAG: hypothetical protein Q8O99_03425 [bacterium]|nr:hypothetical protein [bacterium]